MPHNDATAAPTATATTTTASGKSGAKRKRVGKHVTRSKHVSGKYERKKNMQHLNGIVFYVNYAHCIFFA